jgi:hypothetical protein
VGTDGLAGLAFGASEFASSGKATDVVVLDPKSIRWDAMSTRTGLGTAVAKGNGSELMEWVTAELRTIVAIVDGVSDAHIPTMELLEAGDAVRFALVRLSEWSG